MKKTHNTHGKCARTGCYSQRHLVSVRWSGTPARFELINGKRTFVPAVDRKRHDVYSVHCYWHWAQPHYDALGAEARRKNRHNIGALGEAISF